MDFPKISKYSGFLKYVIMLAFFGMVIFVFYTASKDSMALLNKGYIYSAIIIIPFLIIFFLFYRNGDSFKDPSTVTIMGSSLVLMIGCILYYYYAYQLTNAYQALFGYGINLIIFMIIIIGLAIYYSVFMNETGRLEGWPGFLSSVLFLIPCFCIDFVKYIIQEVQTTPSVVFTLFIIELILILAYIYANIIIKKIYNSIGYSGTQLLNQPLPLTLKTNISSIDAITTQNPTSDLADENAKNLAGENVNLPTTFYSSDYALSMWIYVNNTTPNQTYTLFSCGPAGSSYGKPLISYSGNDQWTFIFSYNVNVNDNTNVQTPNPIQYMTYIPSQKWNNIVFNYNNNNVDLFINGNLEKTMNLFDNKKESYNPYMFSPSDVISVGSLNGIPGAICNIVYYDKPLTKTQISQSWNMLFSQNPPINNLS
jgi:hypothetical protein